MNLIERVKNILLTPKSEWIVINLETTTPVSLLKSYVLPLAAVACLGTLLGYLMYSGIYVNYNSSWMAGSIITKLISYLISFYLSVFVIDMLAPSFASEKNTGKSAQLVAYSLTPVYIGALLSFIPVIGWLMSIAGTAYAVYLLYLGMGIMKKTPEDRKVVYIIVTAVIMIAIYLVLAAILGIIILSVMGIGTLSSYRNY
jgi:hypothetical protein